MDTDLEALDGLIGEKVAEGIFPSRAIAIESIMRWLEELETQFIDEQMRSEDA